MLPLGLGLPLRFGLGLGLALGLGLRRGGGWLRVPEEGLLQLCPGTDCSIVYAPVSYTHLTLPTICSV
eukprot:5804697-Lingulodinium_polyedra.AAC.1